MGEMLANSVIRQVLSVEKMKHYAGFNFMGSHVIEISHKRQDKLGMGKYHCKLWSETYRHHHFADPLDY